MQTILGSSGIIGKEVAKELYNSYTKDIRLVSRDPKKVNPTDQLFTADLLQRDQVMESVKGSDVVYLAVGIQYSSRLWAEQWPVIMRNVIDACKATAMLGNTPSAYKQVWHLPTDRNVLTGKEFMDLTAEAFKVSPGYMLLKKWMVQLAGLFNPIIKESI